MRTKRHAHPDGRVILFLGLALVAGPGCGGRAASPYAGLEPAAARVLARRMGERREADLRADLASAFAARRPRAVLVLSGGDADGAFGCGLLAGWRDAAGDPRPTFDVVTGVSTGALMATFAFLGTERDDRTLRDVYTRARDADIMDGPFTPGPPDSVFDTGPLRRLIARHVTRDVVGRVAAAHRDGRRLYVATVELDAGAVVVWPLSRVAADAANAWERGAADEGDAALERFRKVLLAAASIPVLFPPVEIDGGLHVDAGLEEVLFLRRAMLGPAGPLDPATTTAAAGQSAHEPPPTVYAIVNGKLRTDPEAVPDDLLGIGVRGLKVYISALQRFNLRDAAHVAAAHDPPFRFRWAAVPDDVESGPGPGLFRPMFDPAVMGRLYDAGRAAARRQAWHDGLPPIDCDPPDAGISGEPIAGRGVGLEPAPAVRQP